MLHLFHIDLVVILVRADPLDPHDVLFEVGSHNQSIVIPLDVEDDPVGRDDARGRIAALYVRRARPPCPSDFVEPSVQSCLQRPIVFVSSASLNKLSQSTMIRMLKNYHVPKLGASRAKRDTLA